MAKDRLQKILSAHGVASRRKAELMLLAGRIKVNGAVVTELGTKADPDKDHIEVDGRPLTHIGERLYVALHKPAGYVTTVSDPQGRPTVMDLVTGVKERVYPVGRLDFLTSGLILLTNDGDFAHTMMHPRHEIPKYYLCHVSGTPGPQALRTLSSGVTLEDGLTAPARVRTVGQVGGDALLEIVIHEGRNRQVRRMMEAVGHEVRNLVRTRIGNLALGGLTPGQWRYLRQEEADALRRWATGGGPRGGAAVPRAVPRAVPGATARSGRASRAAPASPRPRRRSSPLMGRGK